jgi:hypothetical protein
MSALPDKEGSGALAADCAMDIACSFLHRPSHETREAADLPPV